MRILKSLIIMMKLKKMTKFGNQFRNLRLAKALAEKRTISIQSVADAINDDEISVTRSTISNIERGIYQRALLIFLALLRYYDLRIVDRAGNEYFTKEKDHE